MQSQSTYYAPMPPQRKRSTWKTLLIIVSLIALVSAVIIGYFVFTAKPPPDGYMNTEYGLESQALRYLHWTETNGQISGYWSIAEVRSVNAKPDYGSGAIKGSRSGNMLSLMFYPSDGVPSTGILENNTLTLQTPARDGTVDTLIFRGVSMKEYMQELNNFKAMYG